MERTKHILIVGGGAAGLSAAARAEELGAQVTVLEANPRCGGNGAFAEVVFALGSRFQAEKGIRCDLDGYFTRSMAHSHYRNNARLLRRLLEASGENLNWLLDRGLPITGLQDEGKSDLGAATHHTADLHTGKAVMDLLTAWCRDRDAITIHTRTRVTGLLTDMTGAVTGVEAEQNGEARTFTGDAVILACGGFSGDPELIHRIIPGLDENAFAHLKGIRQGGGGIRLAEQAGAEILRDGCFESAGPTFAGDPILMGLVTKRYALWLNRRGRRFANEAVGDNFAYGCNAVYAQPGHFCYVLLDGAMVREASEGPVDFLAGPAATARGMGGLEQAIENETAAGRVCRAHSLSEIAAWMGAEPEVLNGEVAEYNRCCAQGRDPVFLKPRDLLRPLETGPYLCIRCGVDCILTHGGLRVDENMAVARADGSPIPGLYAAGADVSGVDGGGYQVFMGGHSFGFSLTGGRLAAESAVTG